MSLDNMKGLKESELVSLGPCRVCGKKLLEGMELTFYKVTLVRAGWDRGALQRRAGLEMMVPAGLGSVFSADEDLAKIVDGPKEVVIHERCAMNIQHLLELMSDETP